MMREKFEIGHIVYEGHKPQRFGKVVEILDEGPPFKATPQHITQDVFYKVRWKDGSETVEWRLNVKSLSGLIADHERKIETHKRNLAKAMEL